MLHCQDTKLADKIKKKKKKKKKTEISNYL